MRLFTMVLLSLALAACAKQPIVMTKPGISQAQVDRDTAECRAQAESARARPLMRPADRPKVYTRVMMGCLRDRGYERSAEPDL